MMDEGNNSGRRAAGERKLVIRVCTEDAHNDWRAFQHMAHDRRRHGGCGGHEGSKRQLADRTVIRIVLRRRVMIFM